MGAGEGLNTGAPLRATVWSTLAPPAVEQRALYAPGDSAHVVAGRGKSTSRSVIPSAMAVPGANGALGLIGVIGAVPPPSAAGLVHSTWSSGSPVRPNTAPRVRAR